MRHRCFLLFFLIFVGNVAYATQAGNAVSAYDSLFKQFTDPETTMQATEEWLILGSTIPEAKSYLSRNLPAVIDKGRDSNDREIWRNATRLAGELKVESAIPSLAKWVGHFMSIDNTEIISTSLSQRARLDHDPAAKALSKIGDPAIVALSEILSHGELSARVSAVRALRLIGTESAKQTLIKYKDKETDEQLRNGIQAILDQWK